MTTIYAPHNNPENRARLLHILTHRHIGQAQAVKKADLLVEMFGPEAAVDKSYNNQYDRSLRAMIEELIQGGQPICSSPTDGYWYAASLEDGLPAADRAKSRALTQLHNAERLEKNIVETYGGQMSLLEAANG